MTAAALIRWLSCCERMQHADRPAYVQPLPQPLRAPRPRIESKPLRGVLRLQRSNRIGGDCRRWRYLGQQPAVRPAELERPVGHSFELIALLVYRPVMAPAE
jgi:hypothetical protein